jgi:uncharacterized protein
MANKFAADGAPTGDEVLSSLQDFIEREHIHAAALTAIGALSDAILLYFNWETKT